jgi:GntR family transcriptional regulator, transcriptional repressor for pyruvate dehydrogenase complex
MLHEGLQNVVRFGSLNFDELIAVRQMLEIPSARLAAVHRTDDHLTRMDRILSDEKAATVHDPVVPQLDVDFHATIAEAAQNRALWAFVFALHKVTHPVHYLDLTDDVGQKTVRQHAKIVAAIRNQDADGAEAAMRSHLHYLGELHGSATEQP